MKTTSACRYVSSRMVMIFWSLCVCSALHSDVRNPCHVDDAIVLSMCTRMASNTARHRICRGIDICCSSAVMAGYLLCRMGSSRRTTTWGPCPRMRSETTSTVVENMKSRHCDHHVSTLPSSPWKQLMTVGRSSTPPASVLMVFVTLSGMLARRFAPRLLSFRKPDTARRLRYSERHSRSISCRSLKPSPRMSSSSVLNMASVNTSCTIGSPPGSSM
mmetsp:Transcript_29733/g.58151  ORF Transcript_29733/g.58151 Transcript_29733/m.58151 type:complete len:217 (-) Transcript_29733:137-787(-)